MSPFNKNISTLLLLALFIIVITFSMNVEADEVDIYNYATNTTTIRAYCSNAIKNFTPYPYEMAYAKDKFLLTLDDTRSVSCVFKWVGERKFFTFEIYNTQRDICVTCIWYVRANGPCFQDQLLGGEKCYTWP